MVGGHSKIRRNGSRRRREKNMGGYIRMGGGYDKHCVALFRLVGHKFQGGGGVDLEEGRLGKESRGAFV